ncbi:fibronectin type III domain-containing protein, partial [[Clostridium] innocuum]|nr:fibronectin type III domain-containing protein [[Clostridium] innocuum]
NWYRIDADGKRSASISRNDYYQIKNKQDIGMKIEAVFSGDSTQSYAGEINAFSEEVKKAEVDAPTDIMAENQIKATDSTLTFTLPDQDPPTGALGANERFIIGYSLSENGVPVEYREDDIVKEYEPKTEVTLKNLKRNTTYYLFLRYSEQDEHYKSDWSAVDHRVQVKTKETALSGTMVFSYAGTNAQKP